MSLVCTIHYKYFIFKTLDIENIAQQNFLATNMKYCFFLSFIGNINSVSGIEIIMSNILNNFRFFPHSLCFFCQNSSRSLTFICLPVR